MLVDQVAANHPGIRKVPGGYQQHLVEHAAALGFDMGITTRKPGTRRFTSIPKRWAVERTYGSLMLHRRLARDYETPFAPEGGGRLVFGGPANEWTQELATRASVGRCEALDGPVGK